MARKKKAREAEPPQAEGDSLALVPSTGEAAAAQAEELRKWMAGESTILAWLEEDPSQQPTFYTDALDVLDLDPELKARVEKYEDEIASLRQKLESAGDGAGPGMGQENSRLRSELDRLTKANGELRDRTVSPTSESLKEKEAAMRDLEADLEMRERALSLGGGDGAIMLERYRAELREKEAEARSRENDLSAKVELLERELKTREIEIKLREDELKLAKMSKPEASKEIEEKIRGFQEKERRILELQDTISRMKDLLTEREDELKGLKEI